MFEPQQFRQLIYNVLREFSIQYNQPNIVTPEAVELLMLTAAQETHLGTYLHQVNGPALGVFQIEWSTYEDLLANYVNYRYELANLLKKWESPGVDDRIDLMGNLPYQIVVARLIYLRVPRPLPGTNDIDGLAMYWKKYWNTHLGKGTVTEAVHNYTRLVLEK